MRYFLDTEFIEGTQKGIFNNKPTIDLISIGIVCEDGREYYAISKDFNLKEAWNRYDEIKDGFRDCGLTPNFKKVYWLRDNVLTSIWNELMLHHTSENWYHTNIHFGDKVYNSKKLKFNYKSLKWLINKYGKTNKQIAEEIKDFVYKGLNDCTIETIVDKKGNTTIEGFPCGELPQFYGYYSDYDWVVFCWLFGKMINLPKGFPMYCIDLKQTLDEKVNNLNWLYLRDTWNNSRMSIKTIGKGDSQEKDRPATFDEKSNRLKELDEYPKQTNEHNALADAKWNYKLYNFLNTL